MYLCIISKRSERTVQVVDISTLKTFGYVFRHSTVVRMIVFIRTHSRHLYRPSSNWWSCEIKRYIRMALVIIVLICYRFLRMNVNSFIGVSPRNSRVARRRAQVTGALSLDRLFLRRSFVRCFDLSTCYKKNNYENWQN